MEIKVVRRVMEENENLANEVRQNLRSKKQIMVNFMGSPGSGKTKLIESILQDLAKRDIRAGVIVGDITTICDAERFQKYEVPTAQINTEPFGGACHLGANMVLTAMHSLKEEPVQLLLLENVGNLVCPAEFDTGSDLNVAVLSVAEGEEKPLKYPLMFRNSHVAVLSKVDVAEALETDMALLKENLRKINPELTIMETSGKTGEGVPPLTDLLLKLYEKNR